MTRHLLLAPILACGLLLAGAVSEAQAGLLPVTWSVTPEAGKYRWTYAIVLPTDAMVRSGDYFTIYDFAGLVPNSNFQPEGWNFSTMNSGPIPPGVDPDDNSIIPNLTWSYAGAEIGGDGKVGLGNFWAVSDYEDSTYAFFTARTHRSSDGRIDTNITPTTVPVPSATPPPEVPEPATLALAGLGLPLVGLFRLVRRRR